MENKTNLYGLVAQCPFGDECLDCPLKEIRKINDFEKQIEIIDNMTNVEIDKIASFHDNRRYEREKHLWKNLIEIRNKPEKID